MLLVNNLKFERSGKLDSTPIFFLGMPRSGTTLVEQILSSHPKVFGADEVEFIPTLIRKNFVGKNFCVHLCDLLINSGQEFLEILSNGHQKLIFF